MKPHDYILLSILAVLIYAVNLCAIFLYIDNIVKDFKCIGIRRIIKVLYLLPIVHLAFYPIMAVHGIIVGVKFAYHYIIED